jgi:hypothetical protein
VNGSHIGELRGPPPRLELDLTCGYNTAVRVLRGQSSDCSYRLTNLLPDP